MQDDRNYGNRGDRGGQLAPEIKDQMQAKAYQVMKKQAFN